MGVSAPSLHRESTDSLIYGISGAKVTISCVKLNAIGRYSPSHVILSHCHEHTHIVCYVMRHNQALLHTSLVVKAPSNGL